MDLSLVIPVWNDLYGLNRLLNQVAELDLFSEIVIADDASDQPPGPNNVPAAAALSDRIIWLRSDQRRGAGYARNMALSRITGDHVIFFDSDDLFAADFPQIIAQATLEPEPFDFLIFRHDDSRLLDAGERGSFPKEEKSWQSVRATDTLSELTTMQAPVLCRISAYPWNKIYRTQFLRDNQIRCTETMVHNDVELHWSSFVTARRILTSALIGATHFVPENGRNLTNRRGADRLEVFHTFENVLLRITAAPTKERLKFLQPFARFSCELIDWVRDNIETAHHPELLWRTRRYFLASLDRQLMTFIAYTDPAVARKINRLVLKDI